MPNFQTYCKTAVIKTIQYLNKDRHIDQWIRFSSYLNGPLVFPTFFNLSLNFAIRSSWSETQLAPGLVFAFVLWCWRRLFRVLWTARRSNQSILKKISPGCSVEGLMLKLKLQYFGHLMQRDDSFEKTLVLGKIEGRRRRGQQRMRWLDHITDLMDMNLDELREMVRDREAWHTTVHGVTKSRTRLGDWVCRQCVSLNFVGK